jgi:hypothetical protein
MNIEKIIIPQKNRTSSERDEDMLKSIQKHMNTGPIIGEAREVILTLSRNIMVRDYLLQGMGVSIESREKWFNEINVMLDEQDAEILKARKIQ